MSLRSWWSSRKRRKRLESASSAIAGSQPLREFVYLDAVSLNSLLVSQKDTIPQEVSEAMTQAAETELRSSASADAVVAKGEFATRYQTSNSNNVQTSRKAIVQTLFKEFRELPLDFKLATEVNAPSPLASLDSLASAADQGSAWRASDVRRGDLVEIDVTLAVDPVFKLGSMMSEWTGMAADWPDMFSAHGALGFLRGVQPIMKVLDRFLAGLIPIKATAVSHVVVEYHDDEYVVRSEAVEGLDLPALPLRIVGVTEHLGYWKDIRRVLFSEGRFTMLCRVARDGIHASWTPVKLADLFSDVAPGLVDQINSIEFSGDVQTGSASPQGSALAIALTAYRQLLIGGADASEPHHADAQLAQIVLAHGDDLSATSQRAAFDAVRSRVLETLDIDPPSPEEDLDARQKSRESAGLPLFPAMALVAPSRTTGKASEADPQERLLDVEVVAIYW